MDGIDEIKEIEIEKNIQTSQPKGEKENEEKSDSKISKNEELKKNWEGFLGMKLMTFKEYENLNKNSRIFNLIKFTIIALLLLFLISSLFYFIFVFKDKDFSQDISLNNNVTIPQDLNIPVNVQINETNNPTINLNATIPIQINATVNINQIILNSS